MNTDQPGGLRTDGETPLNSWKEIGAYLQRNSATARRWEKEEGLPVHRHTHKSRSSVYSYPSEIDAWRASRKVVPEPVARPLWRIPAFALTMLLCLMMLGNGGRPVSAQQPKQTARQVWAGKAFDGYAAPSLDGRYLVYTDWSTGSLAVRDLTTGSNRILAESGYKDGNAEHAVVSPDGRLVAYAWINYTTEVTELRILSIAGGGSGSRIVDQNKEILYLWPGGWTPDGKQLLLARQLRDQTKQIAMMSVQDGSLRVLKSFGWQGPDAASLSPDGRYVAYDAPASDEVPTHDVYVLAVDGSQESKVADSPAIDWSPQWSADGSRVLFLSDRTGSVSLWSVPVEAGKKTADAVLVKENVGPVVLTGVTRDETLYYNTGVMGRRNAFVAELDAAGKAGKPPAIAAAQFINSNRGPAWSPNGRHLAYLAFRVPSANMPGSAVLVIRTLKTGEERQIAMPRLRIPAYAFAPPPRWFPDGKSMLIASYDQKPGAGFYRVSLEDNSAQLLHHSATGPGMALAIPSAGGKIIFYIDNDPPLGPTRIMRFDLDSRREAELMRPAVGQSVISLAVSPDGTQVAYGISDSKQWTALNVMPSAGGTPREVFRAEHWPKGSRFSLTWSHDQRYLIFARPEGGAANPQALWRVPLRGGDPEKIGISMPDIFFPQMDPEGKGIAFTSRDSDTQEIWALENFLPKPKEK